MATRLQRVTVELIAVVEEYLNGLPSRDEFILPVFTEWILNDERKVVFGLEELGAALTELVRQGKLSVGVSEENDIILSRAN